MVYTLGDLYVYASGKHCLNVEFDAVENVKCLLQIVGLV